MFVERRPKMDGEAGVLPLINVVFLLLIFFMLAGSLGMVEPFEVRAPRSASGEGERSQRVIRLSMSVDGRFALDGQEMLRDILLERLSDMLIDDPTAGIELKADSRLPANHLVRFTYLLEQAGVESVFLVTLPDRP
ncbi:ExbD/TolR family protein [Thioalkalivibrio sp. HK1]|uniref:ExbD/TolR family protein n=1 Tax=Thioalkalivibrio sp. HK1 TaxID=1469245 RepID=UPI0018CC0DC4|nr:biopolymer transporter ExbD [Thioalkalivibrio sp. HK1]